MRHLVLIALFLTQALIGLGQEHRSDHPVFDTSDFSRKFAIVEWLVRYDTIAWKTSDVLMTQDKAELDRLGQDWFCFQDKNDRWHALYGKLVNNEIDLVAHFVVDSAGKIIRTADSLDRDFLISHARALATARAKLQVTIPEHSPLHNQYIKRNADGSFTVWMLPAFQPNRLAVYGGEFIYTIDPTGQKVTKDESYFQGAFRGFKADPPREIWLNYREQEKPTLGAIFFVWYYKEYFTKIFIDNSKSTSTVIKSGTNDYVWVHVEKDEKSTGQRE